MKARLSLLLLIFVFMSVFVQKVVARRIPALWSKSLLAASDNYVLSWRDVEKEVVNASKLDIQEFVGWTPKPEQIPGGDEDIYLFIWARLDDRGAANIRDLDSKKLPWTGTVYPGLIKLRITQSHDLLCLFFQGIESDGHPDPFDFGVIRCLGLVPRQYIDETIAQLRKYCRETDPKLREYCDPSSKKPEATGIYGEEMAEVHDMLEYRKKARLPGSDSRKMLELHP